jgi:CNT family concentrative nucleoside transporter
MQALLGIAVLLGIAWLCSEDRRAVDRRLLVVGIGLQFAVAGLLVHVAPLRSAVLSLNVVVQAVDAATAQATGFLFGHLAGGPAPFEVTNPANLEVIAFRVIPQILVFSVLVALGWYWRVLPLLIRILGAGLRRTLGVGGAVGLGAAASIFVGMVEAPMAVRPLLARLDRGELFVLLTCGMATVAGTVMLLYATILEPVLPGSLGHILSASVISAPAAIVVGALMVPPGQGTETDDFEGPARYGSLMDAVARGTSDGVRLVASVVAMLLVFLALVALVNQLLGALPTVAGAPLTLERILGWFFSPLAWLVGVPWAEAATAGSLLGTKLVLNEFIAYLQLAALEPAALSERSRLVLTYALCGFANLPSLGILVGGLLAMVPERRDEVLALAPRSLLSGTLATLLTGAVIGLVTAGGGAGGLQ